MKAYIIAIMDFTRQYFYEKTPKELLKLLVVAFYEWKKVEVSKGFVLRLNGHSLSDILGEEHTTTKWIKADKKDKSLQDFISKVKKSFRLKKRKNKLSEA